MASVIYYGRTIPDNKSTARYNHALAIGEEFDGAILITHDSPPKEIISQYSENYELGMRSNVGEELSAVYEGFSLLQGLSKIKSIDAVISTFHYSQATASFLFSNISGTEWIVDVYDHPMQFAWDNPNSNIHRFTASGLQSLLNHADMGINAFHPKTPFALGREKAFVMNGSYVENLQPKYGKFKRGRLSAIAVGKTQLDHGMKIILDALSFTSVNVDLDIFGESFEASEVYAEDLELDDMVTFHGHVDNNLVKKEILEADVGFCILPPREDYLYSYPIKCGEYMAAGTIPIVSDFPSLRHLCQDSAVYSDPNPEKLARSIDALTSQSQESKCHRSDLARKRAEAISWENQRRKIRDTIQSQLG